MTWGAIGSAAVGVVGGAIANNAGKKSNGGAGTQTATKEPWMDAAPWLRELLNQGTDLSYDYARNPFSPAQTQAYTNQYALSDGVRNLIPSLLGSLNGAQTSFDPTNPTARPKAFDWTSILGANSAGTGFGLSGGSLLGAINSGGQSAAGWMPPSAAAPAGGDSAAPTTTPNWTDLFMAGTGDRNANYLP